MPTELLAQGIALTTGIMVVTAVAMAWRRSLIGSIRLLALQSWSLAALVALMGVAAREVEVVAMAAVIAALKGWLMPRLLARTAVRTERREEHSRVRAGAGALAAATLILLAVVVSRPMTRIAEPLHAGAVPFAFALVLIGFLLLVTRHRAVSQLVALLVLDNGIGAVSYLVAGGVPLAVELGVSLDVLLVLLILRVLTSHMRAAYGRTDLDDLRELAD